MFGIRRRSWGRSSTSGSVLWGWAACTVRSRRSVDQTVVGSVVCVWAWSGFLLTVSDPIFLTIKIKDHIVRLQLTRCLPPINTGVGPVRPLLHHTAILLVYTNNGQRVVTGFAAIGA